MELARGARKQTGTSRGTHGGGRRPRRLIALPQAVLRCCVFSLSRPDLWDLVAELCSRSAAVQVAGVPPNQGSPGSNLQSLLSEAGSANPLSRALQ